MAFVSEQSFRQLREEWNDLLRKSDKATVFLTWEWLYSWWLNFKNGRKLLLLGFRDDSGRLVGLAPLCVEHRRHLLFLKLRRVTFLGTDKVSSEYLDIIMPPQYEIPVVSVLLQALCSKKHLWDVLAFTDMLKNSPTVFELARQCRYSGLAVRETPGEVCPFLHLPNSIEQCLKSLGRSTRWHLKRQEKRLLNEKGAKFVADGHVKGVDDGMAALFRLHKSRWLSKGERGNFCDQKVRDFHADAARRLASKGALRLFLIESDKQPVAVLYGFSYGGKFYYYQSGFDPCFAKHGVGKVLMKLSIEKAIEEGHAEFDFLRGNESYKLRWTREQRITTNLIAFRRTPRALLYRGTTWLVSALRRLKKVVLTR